MKKTLAMIAVLLMAALVLASCAQNNETAKKTTEETLNYTIYNRTGEVITELSISDKTGRTSTTARNLEVGLTSTASVGAVVDESGMPNLQIAYKTAGGKSVSATLNTKTDAITLLPDTVEFKAPAE